MLRGNTKRRARRGGTIPQSVLEEGTFWNQASKDLLLVEIGMFTPMGVSSHFAGKG